jgi:putative PIG3 family NAD(P)H quinone oxidoreductase
VTDIRGGVGPATSLFISDVIPKPTAGPGQAIVKIKAFGLNRIDIFQRQGSFKIPGGASKILGVEFSGHIESLGPGAEGGFKSGDAVFGLAYGGAYAEYIAVSTQILLHKPEHLSWEQAASIPEVWMTATQALHFVGEFSKGKSVLWHAGASGVSIAGIQLSKAAGASKIYVTTSTQEKIDFCVNELGATAGFNYKTHDWAKEILEATGGNGVDLIIDFVGQAYFQKNLEAAARDGHIVSLGFMSGLKTATGIDLAPFIHKRLRYEGSSLRSRDLDYQLRLREKLERYLVQFDDGVFKTYVEKVFPWESVSEAHQLMERNATKGKLICTIA